MVYVHPQALCESERVGAGTRVWAFAHVMAGAVVGADCNIGGGAFVEKGAVLGDRVTLKNQVMVWDGVTIEDDAFIGPGVVFTNDLYPRSPRMREVAERYRAHAAWLRPTLVGQGASLGAGAVILPGLHIGRHAVIAAGAVVTRDVLPQALVVGNPARQRGWACVCGAPLSETLICRQCQTAYRLVDGAVRRQE